MCGGTNLFLCGGRLGDDVWTFVPSLYVPASPIPVSPLTELVGWTDRMHGNEREDIMYVGRLHLSPLQ